MSTKTIYLFFGLIVLAAGARTLAADLDADPHLLGWWKFDETSGKVAADSSKNKHDGALEGSLAFDSCSAPGRLGKSIMFDGKDIVTITGFKGITGTKPRTVAVWYKTGAAAGDIVAWGQDEGGKMFNITFIRGRLGVSPKGGYLYMNAETHDDKWHHFAVVVREASPPNLHDDVKIYKDGATAVIHDIGLLDLWPIDTGDTLDVRIGRRFKGCIDDLRIYDRPLADDEIAALFKTENKP